MPRIPVEPQINRALPLELGVEPGQRVEKEHQEPQPYQQYRQKPSDIHAYERERIYQDHVREVDDVAQLHQPSPKGQPQSPQYPQPSENQYVDGEVAEDGQEQGDGPQ